MVTVLNASSLESGVARASTNHQVFLDVHPNLATRSECVRMAHRSAIVVLASRCNPGADIARAGAGARRGTAFGQIWSDPREVSQNFRFRIFLDFHDRAPKKGLIFII